MKDELRTPFRFGSQALHEAIAADLDVVRKAIALDSTSEFVLQARRLNEPLEMIRKQSEDFHRQMMMPWEHALLAENATQYAFRDAPAYIEKFRIPHGEEISRLVAEAMNGPAAILAREQEARSQELQKIFESVRAPFLQAEALAVSASALSELQGIGWLLNQANSFEVRWVDALREPLGDWRDPIDWSRWNLDDSCERLELYAERGLDGQLTDFPEPAFVEILNHTGIASASGFSISLLSPVDSSYSDSLIGSVPMQHAYAWLYQLERDLRAFINNVMTAKFGSKWMRQRVPKDVRENCERKRDEAQRAGGIAQAPMEYFDFGDYEKIVARKDNWNEVFGGVFGRLESFLESLRRLYPVRNSIMHSRPLTHEDLLLLLVEARRLSKAIRRYHP